MYGAVTKNTLDWITDKRQNFFFLEGTTVLPACDNMIPPSLESTSCSSAGIFEPVPPSVLSRGTALFCPSCPLSRESSHVVAVLTGWSQICHLLFSSNTHCRLQCIPWLGPVLFQLVWWTELLRKQSLLIIWSHTVGHFSKLC